MPSTYPVSPYGFRPFSTMRGGSLAQNFRMGSDMSTIESSDVLHGAGAIAVFLGMTEKQCRHRIEEGTIPVFRIGMTICARRSTLVRWIADQEAVGYRRGADE